MSSDKFDFIIVEIPNNIDKQMINKMLESAQGLTSNDAIIINRVLSLEPSNVGENLDEDDLFEIGEENLGIKKAVQEFLREAILEVMLPRMYCEKRVSSPINYGDFSYLSLDGKSYVVSGQTVSYYSTKVSTGYKYILAISISNVLEGLLEEKG